MRLKALKNKEMHSTAGKITLRHSTFILKPLVRFPIGTLYHGNKVLVQSVYRNADDILFVAHRLAVLVKN